MLKTGKLQRGFALFFFGYVIIAMAGMNFSPKAEFFPVFSWSLFTAVRSDIALAQVEILSVGDDEFEEPRNFFDMPEVFPAARSRNIRVVKLANRIAVASLRQREPLDPLLAQMENAFLNIGEPLSWRVSLYDVNALEYYRHGTIRQIRPVVDVQP